MSTPRGASSIVDPKAFIAAGVSEEAEKLARQMFGRGLADSIAQARYFATVVTDKALSPRAAAAILLIGQWGGRDLLPVDTSDPEFIEQHRIMLEASLAAQLTMGSA